MSDTNYVLCKCTGGQRNSWNQSNQFAKKNSLKYFPWKIKLQQEKISEIDSFHFTILKIPDPLWNVYLVFLVLVFQLPILIFFLSCSFHVYLIISIHNCRFINSQVKSFLLSWIKLIKQKLLKKKIWNDKQWCQILGEKTDSKLKQTKYRLSRFTFF